VPDPGCEFFWSLQQKVKALGVEEDGSAFRAGIRSGDIIAGINGKVFGSRQELEKFKSSLSIGDTLRLDCLRSGEKVSATVILGSRTLIKSVISEIENPTVRQRRILQGILTGEPR
jgi:S1-C subfamily serine protease